MLTETERKDIIKRLKKYIDSKQDSGHDKSKKNFFNKLVDQLNNKTFSVASLTKAVEKLSNEEKSEVFYLGRSRGPSTKSRSAEWVELLYRRLGTPLSQTEFSDIVKKGINENDMEKFNQLPYENWLKKPLNTTRRFNLDSYLEARLREKEYLNKEQSINDLRIIDKKNLSKALNLIYDNAPEYLPILIGELVQRATYKPTLIDRIFNATQENENISKILFKAGPGFVVRKFIENDFVRVKESPVPKAKKSQNKERLVPNIKDSNPSEFFKLPRRLQQTVFEHIKDNEDFKDRTKQEAFNTLGKGYERAFSDYRFIKEKIIKIVDLDKAITDEQNQQVTQVIKNYIGKKPGQFKADFFNDVLEQIKDKPLFDILNEKLSQTDRKKLFAKWSGAKNSRAAKLSKELYRIANYGEEMKSNVFKTMIEDGILPKLKKETIGENKTKILDERMKQLIVRPDQAEDRPLDQAIKQGYTYLESQENFLKMLDAEKISNLEAAYQQFLMNKGLAKIKGQGEPILDYLGHAMVMVEMTKKDYVQFLNENNVAFEKGKAKEKLKSIIGKISQTILCKLDINSNDKLKKQNFREIPQDQRNSMISLNDEMIAHVLLSLRIFEKKLNKSLDLKFREELISDVFSKIASKVNKIYNEHNSIKNPQKASEDLIAVMNEALDRARPELANKCRKILIDKLWDDETVDNDDLETAIQNLSKKDFSSTTATNMDYLVSDEHNQSILRITATDKTAHNKKAGQALRVIHQNQYDSEKQQVKAYKHQSYDTRVPSIALKEENHTKAVDDVARKLEKSYQVLQSKMPYYQGPIIYNLLTSLHTKLEDRLPGESSNRQRKSAARILKGTHVFNRRQLEGGKEAELFFVQNIAVNGHTSNLDHTSMDDAVKEATLMTNISLLKTFLYHAYDDFSPLIQRSLNNTSEWIDKKYKSFLLQQGNGEHYFVNSKEGKQVVELLKKQKKVWLENLPKRQAINTTDIESLATQALFRIYNQNQHYKKENGMLVQALSVFAEPLSQVGCKSANERYQAVRGRVDLLKSMSGRKNLAAAEKNLKNMLEGFAKGQNSIADLRKSMNKAYNAHNLFGPITAISLEDQGGPSKLRSLRKQGGKRFDKFNTNVAEPKEITRLYASKASKMQAHKAGLDKQFNNLWEEKKQEFANDLLDQVNKRDFGL